jgi:putative DNA primase/helicase
MNIATPDDTLNDIGNAERFANDYFGRLAFVPELGVWRAWKNRRWQDDDDEAVRAAATVARSWFDDLAHETDPGRQKKLLAHAQRSCGANSLHNMIGIAKTLDMTVPQREWDVDPMRIGVLNGVIDLRTGQHSANDRLYRISKSVTTPYIADAKAPIWCSFLDRIMGGSPAMVAFLKRAIGYSLTGDTREQCIFIGWGSGANGKSRLKEAMRILFGDYGRDCPAETLLAKRDQGINNDVARLAGARLVCATETEDGKRFAESQVKALTGCDTVTARFLHREYFEFVPQFKLWLYTNHKPTIRGDDYAIWRRIRLIPFNVTIPEAEQDGDLGAKLAAERAGILNWAVEGCLAWQRDGLQTPEPVRAATADYRADMDRLGQWITERCIVIVDAKVKASFAYQDYRKWADERGEPTLTMTAFGNRLTERGIQKVKGRTVVYIGIGLCDTSATVATDMQVFSPARSRERKETGNVSQVSQSVAGPDNDYLRASRGE